MTCLWRDQELTTIGSVPSSARLEEWIRDLELSESLTVLEILGKQEVALRLDSSGDDQ